MSLAAAFEGSTGLNEAHRREIEGRVGTAGGRAVRSFHINFGSVKASAPAARGWSQAIDYAARQGKYAEDGEELEEGPDVLHVAGSPDALREACKTIDAGVRQRRGKTAERILVKETVELPSDVEDEQAAWKAGAEAIVADWRKRGHEAVAAVHLHGEERDHPHLHVLVAARPVNADGAVDRSRRLLVGKAAVKAERANAAERINEACEPKIHFHPGKLKEIGIERAAKKRIPQGEFRARRAEIRAAPEKAAAIEASMYAMSAAERAPLHVERTARYEARKPIIEAAKAAGRWPPRSRLREQQILTRSWRVTYEDMKAEKQKAWDDANYWIVEGHQAEKARDEQRARAEKAEASVTTAAKDRKALETELNTAKKDRDGWEKNTLEIVKLAYEQDGRDLPDLGTDAGLDAAAEFLEGGAGRAEAITAARAEEQEKAAKDRKALETELNTAKADAAGWEKNTLEIVRLAYEQAGVDLPDLGTDAGLDAAAEFLQGGAGRAEAVAAVRAEEREEAGRTLIDAKAAWQDERAALAAERDNAKNETSALRAHSAEQTEFLTGVHRESRRDLPDLETGEGRSAAWAFARAVMKAGREAAAEKKELEQRVAPEQLQQPADEALRYFTAAEREAAETRQRKAEAKKAKRGEQSEKEKADGEISEACKPVYRMWKQTGDKIGRALADGGGLAAAAEAYGQYHGSPLSLRKDATEEKLAGVLAAINAAAARLGAETLKRPLTVEEAAAEYEQRRPKTNAERLAASGAAALAAEEEERLRPAKELAAEIEVRASWNLGWRSPAPASGKSRLQTPPRAVQPEPSPAPQVQTPKPKGKQPLNPRSKPTRDEGR